MFVFGLCELMFLGLDVVLVQPGPFRTGMTASIRRRFQDSCSSGPKLVRKRIFPARLSICLTMVAFQAPIPISYCSEKSTLRDHSFPGAEGS